MTNDQLTTLKNFIRKVDKKIKAAEDDVAEFYGDWQDNDTFSEFEVTEEMEDDYLDLLNHLGDALKSLNKIRKAANNTEPFPFLNN